MAATKLVGNHGNSRQRCSIGTKHGLTEGHWMEACHHRGLHFCGLKISFRTNQDSHSIKTGARVQDVPDFPSFGSQAGNQSQPKTLLTSNPRCKSHRGLHTWHPWCAALLGSLGNDGLP